MRVLHVDRYFNPLTPFCLDAFRTRRRYTTAAATSLEREKQSLGARVTELERVVAEGEACLRDMEHEREEQRRKYKRATAAETAGRLAAEATAAALQGEVSRLHGALERFGFSLQSDDKHKPAVETVGCMTSPIPATATATTVTGTMGTTITEMMGDDVKIYFNSVSVCGNDEEDEDVEDDLDDAMMESSSMMMDCSTGTPGGLVSDDFSSMPPVTPVTSVKAAAKAIDAAVVRATRTSTSTSTPAAADMSYDDSAMGCGGMRSVGPASVGSKPASKHVASVEISPAAFSLEYTPLSKPSAAAAAAPVPAFGVGDDATSVGGVGVVSLAADFASAADVELFNALTTMVQCALALVAAAWHNSRAAAKVGAAVAAGAMAVTLVVVGIAAAAEVVLQLSGDPPTLRVPVRMGGLPSREMLRRVGAA